MIRLSAIVGVFAAVALAQVAPMSLSYAQQTSSDDLDARGFDAPVARTVAVLRALDKITARITEIEVPVGEEVSFGTLRIKVRYCRSRPPEEPPETYAYLEITDRGRGDVTRDVFSGWMLASSPSLHAVEHPVYDVWVISCKIRSGEASSSSR